MNDDVTGKGGQPVTEEAAEDRAFEPFIGREALEERVRALGGELTERFTDAPEPPILIAVLKGSTMFLADLVREITIDAAIDFMAISSYSSDEATQVRIVKDLEHDINGRDVAIVEDIVDTGLTLTYLRRSLTERSPRSLCTVTLLDKSARRLVPVEVEHIGFDIPDVFVVGYGMDFQGRYRNAPDLYSVKDPARLANDPLLLVPTLFSSSA